MVKLPTAESFAQTLSYFGYEDDVNERRPTLDDRAYYGSAKTYYKCAYHKYRKAQIILFRKREFTVDPTA